MLQRLVSILVLTVALAGASASYAAEIETTARGVVVPLSRGVVRVSAPRADILRIEVARDGHFADRASPVLVPTKLRPLRTETASPTVVEVASERARVTIDVAADRLAFFRSGERHPFLTTGVSLLAPVEIAGDRGVSVLQRFDAKEQQSLYGLGTYQDGVMDWRCHSVRIAQSNTTSALPVLMSSRGWGLLWHNASRTEFRDDGRTFEFESVIGDSIDYFVFATRDLDAAIAAYRAITGRAPLFPRSAYGYWQSKERYESAAELLEVADEYRRRALPLDNLVLDWNWWPDFRQWSGMEWDRSRFPDPRALTDALHDRHVKLMVSIWPAVGVDSALHRDLDAIDGLLPGEHWAPAHVVDAWREEPRRVYWQRVRTALLEQGVDAWWMDATEPTFLNSADRYITEDLILANRRNSLGSMARQLNTYSLEATRGAWEMQRAAAPDKRVFILTRSSFAGQQRHGAVLWSGDIQAGWTVFRAQIAAGLNYAAAGMPYWTTDTGGFGVRHNFPRGLDDPAFRELYVRWFQYAAFSPMFRAHGTDVPREIWRFGDEGTLEYRALAGASRLRYRLLPYVYSVAGAVTHEDRTFLRPLVMDFAGDRRARRIPTQYLFGPALLVSPVTRALDARPDDLTQAISSSRLRAPDGRGPGLEATYFRDTDLESPVAARMTEVLHQPWYRALPRDLDGKPYSVRLEGQLLTATTGRYRFVAQTNGGVRVRVAGRLIIDEWNNADDRRVEGQIDLPRGSWVPITIEHRQPKPETSGLLIEWEYPGLAREVVSSDGTFSWYLPKAPGWIDFWTGRSMRAGRAARAAVPLDQIPIQARAGAIVPLGPELQWTDERPADPMELRIYPGADGEFTLYEDAGEGYAYESGEYSKIRMTWDDRANVLRIGARTGRFAGMLGDRTFEVVRVRPGHGVGLQSGTPDRVVRYDGSPVEISLPRR